MAVDIQTILLICIIMLFAGVSAALIVVGIKRMRHMNNTKQEPSPIVNFGLATFFILVIIYIIFELL